MSSYNAKALLAAFVTILAGTQSLIARDSLVFEFAGRSTFSVWQIEYTTSTFFDDGYIQDIVRKRTSRPAFSFGPQVAAWYRGWYASVGADFGGYEYRGGGESDLSHIDVALGAATRMPKGMIMLSVAYERFRATFIDLDPLFTDHNITTIGLRLTVNSRPQSNIRWRWTTTMPLDMFTHLFSVTYLEEHDEMMRTELTIGYKPRGSSVFFDFGYHFWVATHNDIVLKEQFRAGPQTIRHGAVLRVGVVR